MSDSNPITLASIVAIAKNHAIGKDGGMIWHLPEDLKHFKRTTMGKPILMGRKSYESLGKPLPGRPNIVVSRNFDSLPQSEATEIHKDMEAAAPTRDQTTPTPHELHYVKSISEGIEKMRSMAEELNIDEIFITGGGQIYAETLPYTQRLYLTVLDREYEGDTFFPEFDWSEWNITLEEKHPADPANNRPAFTFFTLERK
jgi:dihydrofolate reductase